MIDGDHSSRSQSPFSEFMEHLESPLPNFQQIQQQRRRERKEKQQSVESDIDDLTPMDKNNKKLILNKWPIPQKIREGRESRRRVKQQTTIHRQ